MEDGDEVPTLLDSFTGRVRHMGMEGLHVQSTTSRCDHVHRRVDSIEFLIPFVPADLTQQSDRGSRRLTDHALDDRLLKGPSLGIDEERLDEVGAGLDVRPLLEPIRRPAPLDPVGLRERQGGIKDKQTPNGQLMLEDDLRGQKSTEAVADEQRPGDPGGLDASDDVPADALE